MVKLSRIRYWLLFSLIVTMPMSYLPSLPLPLLNFPSFRIGLYQLLAMAFVLSCLPLLVRRTDFLKNRLVLIGFSLLVLTLTFGLFNSLVPDRSALYITSLLALVTLGFSGYVIWQELNKKDRQKMLNALLWSGIIFGLLAVIQLILASFDKQAFGTLCSGCSDAVFGFPRINLFAAEPQFFANSLLPTFFAGLVFRNHKKLAKWSLILSSIAVTLTFSRGAFLAVAAGLTVFLIVNLIQKSQVKAVIKPLIVVFAGFLLGFAMLITSASLRYQNTPNIAYNTTISMVEHLSLGAVSLPLKTAEVPSAAGTENFVPEGFVEASSSERLSAAELATRAWASTPFTMIFGVGMGNLGAYVNTHITAVPSNLTVYIFYILVLSELGLIGLLLLISLFGLIIYRAARSKNLSINLFIILVTTSFAVQFMFFGSYINVMYIYLLLGLFLAITQKLNALPKK